MSVQKQGDHLVKIDRGHYVPLATYSEAITEIYSLRALLVSEARILEAHGEYKTFPKSRRVELAVSVEAMREAARGAVSSVLGSPRYRHYRNEFRAAGIEETLTNWQWESQTFANDGTEGAAR